MSSPGPRVVCADPARFTNLSDYPFAPHFCGVTSVETTDVRMHYVDEGDPAAAPVLLLHGEPTWSYLYRHVVPVLADAGHRVLAPDHIGFGRSDKFTEPSAYTYAGHVEYLRTLVRALDLRDVTLVCQDWGGPIGLGVLAAEPERFARVVVANTILHTADAALAGQLEWPVHGAGERQVVVSEDLLDWMLYSQRAPELRASDIVRASTVTPLSEAAAQAYDAPFPSAEHEAGKRQFPILIPVTRTDPGAEIGRRTWAALETFERPLLTAYSDGDPATRGWERIFQTRVPGAAGQPHCTIAGAGHFLQEDCGAELGKAIAAFIRDT